MKNIFLKTIICLIFFLTYSSNCFANQYDPSLFKNINNTLDISASSSLPDEYVKNGNIVYFISKDHSHGKELWKTDGTESGTVLVKDIYPGINGSSIDSLILFNNQVYFSANDGVHGAELWKTDGTESGTVMVKDINIGKNSSSVLHLTSVNDQLYFSADDGYGNELWKSDGTESGTVMVKNISAHGNSSPSFLINYNDSLFFSAYLNDGNELWKTDGTEAGTVMVKNINNSGSGLYGDPGFVVFNNYLYFSADDGIHGKELWKSDGTEAGTTLIKDIYSGSSDSLDYYSHFIVFNNYLYFSANDGVHGTELWKTDGTESGTSMLEDIYIGSNNGLGQYPLYFIVFNNYLYFSANDGVHGTELWKTDGTVSNTVMVEDINSGSGDSINQNIFFVILDGSLYFSANDGVHGTELWKTDGTVSNTVMVKDINSGTGDGLTTDLVNIVIVDNKMLLSANDGIHGYELWKTDGTEVGTVMIKNIKNEEDSSSSFRYLDVVNNTLYFQATNGSNGLWKSDGTESGTTLIKEFSSGPYKGISFNSELYFVANDGVHGRELWKTDGTESGTIMVKDTYVGSSYSQGLDEEPYFTIFNNNLYFVAYNGCCDRRLWKTDGTETGTVVVSSKMSFRNISYFATFNDHLYFVANDGIHGYELWKTDGTESGTVMVKDTYTGSSNGMDSDPYFTILGDYLYFSKNNDDYSANELWKTDGTESGTTKIFNRSSVWLIPFNNYVYFNVSGKLWKTDGTESGTVLVKDISIIPKMVVLENNLFFSADDGVHGYELWKSDGTESGTVMVKDVNTTDINFGSSEPNYITLVGNNLYFSAFDGIHGRELWKSDGTETGTVMVKDLKEGESNGVSSEVGLFKFGNNLYFKGDDGVHGYEPWFIKNVDSINNNISAIINKPIINGVGGTLSLSTSSLKVNINVPASVKSSLSYEVPLDFQIKEVTSNIGSSGLSNNEQSVSAIADLKAFSGVGTSIITFDKPITVTIDYDNSSIDGLDADNLSIYRYDGLSWQKINSTVDKVNHKVIATTNHLSLFKIFSTEASLISLDSSSGQSNNIYSIDHSCHDSKPTQIPDLFQINIIGNSAKLFFTPLTETNNYYISFSKNSNAEEHGELVSLRKEGVQSHSVYHLDSNSTYYFKVRGQNGCMPGSWSNILKIKTGNKSNKTAIFYKNSNLVFNTVKLVKNKITQKSANIITPTPIPIVKSTNTKTDSNPVPVQKSKKCFLWWCW